MSWIDLSSTKLSLLSHLNILMVGVAVGLLAMWKSNVQVALSLQL